MTKRILLLLVYCFVVIGLRAQTYQQVNDISYTKKSDAYAQERLKLDVYYPEGMTDCPVVVWFHGGGLEGGNKEIPQQLMQKGWVVIGVNYRLLPKVTIDELLSSDEVLSIAEEDHQQTKNHFCDLVFGLLDFSIAMFFFLPLFGQKTDGSIEAVSLLFLTEVSPWLRICYLASVAAMTLWGILTLALQNWDAAFWVKNKSNLSLGLTGLSVLLFIFSRQPYAAAFLFVFFVVKGLLLLKKKSIISIMI